MRVNSIKLSSETLRIMIERESNLLQAEKAKMRHAFSCRFVLSRIIAIALASGAVKARATVEYHLVDLGSRDGQTIFPVKINDQSEIACVANDSAGVSHAYIWNGGGLTELTGLGGGCGANGMNNLGEVVGYSYTRQSTGPNDIPPRHAVLWSHGITTDVSAQYGQSYGYARAINSGGQILEDGVLLTHGVSTTLPTLGGYTESNTINATGLIAGSSATGSYSPFFACIWLNGAISVIGRADTEANDVNDLGHAVGYGPDGAYLWHDGMTTRLGDGDALAINNGGTIVGQFYDQSTFDYHGFVVVDGREIDLNALTDAASGMIIEQAIDVDESGEIIGDGYDPLTQSDHGYLLEPVPEPGLSLFFAAVLAIVAKNIGHSSIRRY